MSTSPRKLFGFTLLELLVVMAIIGILAAIGIASYGTVQSKARDARRKSDLENVARALEMYYNDNGVYPSGNVDGQIVVGVTEFQWGEDTFSNAGATYMEKLPKDDRFGYFYQPTSDHKGYRLFARLENREDQKAARTTDAIPLPAEYVITADAEDGAITVKDTSCKSGCNYGITSTNKSMPTTGAELEAD